jgi:hypothetical protein
MAGRGRMILTLLKYEKTTSKVRRGWQTNPCNWLALGTDDGIA